MSYLYSTEYRNNPYPYFQKMRAQSPIFSLREGYWGIANYNDVKTILKNHELFSSADIVQEPNELKPDFLLYTRGIVGVDKPDHTRIRQLLYKLFPQNKTAYLEPIIRQPCQQLISLISNQTYIDIVKNFTAILPMMVIAKLLGLEGGNIEEFRYWVQILLTWRLHSYDDKDVCINKMFYYFIDLIHEKRKSPTSDLISALIASSDNNAITEIEILAMIRFLFVAGTDTTTNLLGNTLRVLLDKPDYIPFLQQQPAKIDAFIEETLRYDGPVLCLYRRALEDVELNGITIKQNDLVFPFVASANHDETIFANPTCFDMERDAKAHLSFGSGIHHCFSSQLAKLQVRIACEELLTAFAHFEKLDDTPPSYMESFFFRGPKSLPIKIYWTAKLNRYNFN